MATKPQLNVHGKSLILSSTSKSKCINDDVTKHDESVDDVAHVKSKWHEYEYARTSSFLGSEFDVAVATAVRSK